MSTTIPARDTDIAVLDAVQRRVLWLATSIVHHANRVRRTPSGVKVGGHQASSASMVSIMTALYFHHLRAPDRVSVKPHAAPVLHAIEYLLGQLDRRHLTELRAFGGLQSYPSRLKDPVPADFSTGSVGIGATAPIWSALAHRYVAGHFDVPQGGRQVSLVGDAELDEGAVWEAIVDPVVTHLGEVLWIVDLNRQSLDRVVPDIAAGRLAAMFEAAGWHVNTVKYGRRLSAHPALCDRITEMPNEEYQRLLRADRRRASCAGASASAASRHRRRRPARHRPRPRRPRPRPAPRRLRRGRRRHRPPVGDLRLHDQGVAPADRGPSRQPLRAADRRPVGAARRGARRRRRPTRGRRSSRARRRPSCAPRSPRGCAGRRSSCGRSRRSRPTSAAAHTGKESTQQAFGRFFVDLSHGASDVAARVVTVSPDVASSTNLGGWINRGGIWHLGDRIDWFADDTDTLVRWRETEHGQHIELGIAEGNLVGLLAELGLTWSRDGQPLLPVGTLYDPFVNRALEPWSFGLYAGAQSILVGTPSGVTLAPEGGAHQSITTPSVGLEQPRCIAWEPAFGQDLEWTLLARAVADRPPGRDVVVLPPHDAARRPGARRRARRRGGARAPARARRCAAATSCAPPPGRRGSRSSGPGRSCPR